MKKLLSVIFASAFCIGVAGADETEDQIARYDQNQDGVLSKQEISANQELSASFEQLDANGDGLLGEDELDSGLFDDFDEMGEDPLDDE